MPFKPVILWTDALVFLLVAAVITFGWYVARHEHLMAPWRKVMRSRYGMCALVVLAPFIVVGLLDSLHYRPRLETMQGVANAGYSVEVLSLLDKIAAPLRTHIRAHLLGAAGSLRLRHGDGDPARRHAEAGVSAPQIRRRTTEGPRTPSWFPTCCARTLAGMRAWRWSAGSC